MERYIDVRIIDLSIPLYGENSSNKMHPHKNCVNIKSIYQFFVYIKNLEKISKGKNVCLLNNIKNNTFKEVLCNLIVYFLLKDTLVKSFDLFNGGVVLSQLNSSKNQSMKNSFIRLFRNDSLKQIWKAFNRYFFKRVAEFLPTSVTHRFVAGEDWEVLAASSLRGKTLVYGHSFDYSKIFSYENNVESEITKKAVFLSDSGLRASENDSFYLAKGKYSRSPDAWFKSLVSFFDYLENETEVKVEIAGHYKTSYKPIEPKFGNRKVYYDKTMELIRNCDYVIAINSTAISYAVAFKKPILFIYSDELQREKLTMNSIFNLSSSLGLKPININSSLSRLNISEYLSINDNLYENYVRCALTSLLSPKDQNYKIILSKLMEIKIY